MCFLNEALKKKHISFYKFLQIFKESGKKRVCNMYTSGAYFPTNKCYTSLQPVWIQQDMNQM